MKLSHAAALALIGWYLMVPPPVVHNRLPVNLEAPLSEWRLFSAHDSAAECMQGLIHSTKLQRQNCSQSPVTKVTGYGFTSLRTLSASPATTRASRKNRAWPLRFNCSPAATPRAAACAGARLAGPCSPDSPTLKTGRCGNENCATGTRTGSTQTGRTCTT